MDSEAQHSSVKFVHYLELKALEGQTKIPPFLLDCQTQLEQFSACTSALVLKNSLQPGLFLLQSLWTSAIPALEWKGVEGWKTGEWSFEVVNG